MRPRLFAALIVLVLLLAACGAKTDPSASTDTQDPPPAEMALSDIADEALTITENNERLDDICRRKYSDAQLTPDVTVGLVADVATIDDGGFNQAAFEGMEAARRCFGVNTTFLETAGDDAEAQIRSLVDRDVDIVVTVGFQFGQPTVSVAKERPETFFIGVDQVNPNNLENYVAISFRDDEVGYLAGAIAGLVSETGIIAVVAGPEFIPPVVAMADGYELGAKSVSDDVIVLRKHMESFSDPEAGAEQANIFVDEGADVVFNAAGPTGAGAITEAAARNAKVIGVDQDQYYTIFAGGALPNSEQLVTSAVKRVDLGIFLTIAAFNTGQVDGGAVVLGASSGGVSYAPFHEAEVSDSVAEQIEQLRIDLATGAVSATTE